MKCALSSATILKEGLPLMSSSPSILINGKPQLIYPGEPLIEAINRSHTALPQVCYHEQLGPIQTCDTCMVEIDGTTGSRLRNSRQRGNANCYCISCRRCSPARSL